MQARGGEKRREMLRCRGREYAEEGKGVGNGQPQMPLRRTFFFSYAFFLRNILRHAITSPPQCLLLRSPITREGKQEAGGRQWYRAEACEVAER